MKLGPVDGFMIHTPDDRKLKDTHPQTIVRELNRLNDEIEEKRKDIVYLATEKAKLEERIKRLEEDSQRLNWLLNRGLAWRGCYNDWWKAGEWLYASQSALETIDEAKDAK